MELQSSRSFYERRCPRAVGRCGAISQFRRGRTAMKRAVAVTLKIPDNTAYTTALALRNLGLPVERVERSEIWFFNDGGSPTALLARIESDATIFNPNKHRATVID